MPDLLLLENIICFLFCTQKTKGNRYKIYWVLSEGKGKTTDKKRTVLYRTKMSTKMTHPTKVRGNINIFLASQTHLDNKVFQKT